MNERVGRFLILNGELIVKKKAWEQAVPAYLEAERAFREAWDDLTSEEQEAVNAACEGIEWAR